MFALSDFKCLIFKTFKQCIDNKMFVWGHNVLTGRCTSSYLELLTVAFLGQISLQDACYSHQISPVWNEGDSSSTLLAPKTSKLEDF